MRDSLVVDYKWGQYIQRRQWHMKDKTLRLAEGCLNLTIIRKTEHQKQRLKPTGLAKPGKTCTFLDMDSDLAYLEAAGWIFRWV